MGRDGSLRHRSKDRVRKSASKNVSSVSLSSGRRIIVKDGRVGYTRHWYKQGNAGAKWQRRQASVSPNRSNVSGPIPSLTVFQIVLPSQPQLIFTVDKCYVFDSMLNSFYVLLNPPIILTGEYDDKPHSVGGKNCC